MDLHLTTFDSRRNPRGAPMLTTWDDFCTKLSKPIRTSESLAEYQADTNDNRTDIKDVGGYVAGEFAGHRRSKAAMRNRCILTVDADDAADSSVDDFLFERDVAFFCHTTHSSTPDAPRLRWLFPLTRPVDANEYRVLMHVVSSWVGVDTIDDSTDQPERLMFWPSCSADAEYGSWRGTGDVIDPDALLASSEGQAAQAAVQQADKGTVQEFIDGDAVNVPEGHRNKRLFSFAASLRHNGLDEAGIQSMLTDYNNRYCNPPVEDWEVQLIVRSVCTRYAPGEAVAESLKDEWDKLQGMGVPVIVQESEKEIKMIRAETLESLMARQVPSVPYVIPGLISEGLTVLASPPKYGKSYMSMQMSIAVASGRPFLGYKTNQTGVAYFALEDSASRLKTRAEQFLMGSPPPKNLYLIPEAPSLEEGFCERVTEFLESVNGSVGLVIIDTLQKIRGQAKKTEGVYGYDYRELGKLQRWALDHHLAVVVIHHLNKGMGAGDFVARLNGSMGVSGAADTIITMDRVDRRDPNTIFHVTGRDVGDIDLVLTRTGVEWISLGTKDDYESQKRDTDYVADPVVKAIKYALDEEEMMQDESESSTCWRCTSAELLDKALTLYGESEALQSATVVGRHVAGVARKLLDLDGIAYEYTRSKTQRYHVFTRERV